MKNLQIKDHLNVSAAEGIAFLMAKSVWGALRGMETFSQLVYFTYDQNVFFYQPNIKSLKPLFIS